MDNGEIDAIIYYDKMFSRYSFVQRLNIFDEINKNKTINKKIFIYDLGILVT